MTNCIRIVALLLVAGAVSTAALLHWGGREGRTAELRPSEGALKGRIGPIYPEIQGPASLSMDLAEGAAAGAPVVLHVSASSTIPIASGTITLRVPEITGESNRTDVLWTGAAFDALAETVVCPVGALPVGRHCFIAIFEFTPAGENAQDMAISQCLYLDVRPETILSSNVSFEQIKRVELRQELERRILVSLKPKFAAASDDVVGCELAALEAGNPGFMDRAIEELIAADPDVTHCVAELNERITAPTDDIAVGP